MTAESAPTVSGLWRAILPRVNLQQCARCHFCAPEVECLARAFRREPETNVPLLDPSLCLACYACVVTCPHGAVVRP
jgi:TPP-dependent indolepyruvate ferredoxin oxidoreductase alpha subunit